MDVAFSKQDWESVMAIRDALAWFLDLRGYWDEAIQHGAQALQAARHAVNEQAIAYFTHILAVTHQQRGSLYEARRLYDESLEINKKLGDQLGIASTLHQLGRLAEVEGNKSEVVRLYRESLSILEKLGSPDVKVPRRSLARVEGESS
jgi:tetratricopeptide (TPR) repeat protein